MNFKEELSIRTKDVESVIEKWLPKEEGFSRVLAETMNYSMNAKGKRIRPILLLESYRMTGADGALAGPFMAAIEMIHTHSLIHDDLPAIDGDLYRRGRKTTHAVYGEALGILSGDALLNYAYETAFCAFDGGLKRDAVIKALKVLSEKTGYRGMLGGQSVDVTNEKNDRFCLPREELDYIYRNKTSALLEASLMIGCILREGSKEACACMEQIGRKVGLAFQIQDDILDVTATAEVLGKPVLSDEKNHKTTYVTLMGISAAKQEVERLTEEAVQLLLGLPGEKAFLEQLLYYLAFREK